jgi:hypothetical protein
VSGFVVTGSPLQGFIDAFKARAEADATLMALIEGIYGHLDETERTPYPYLVFGQEQFDGNDVNAGAMGLPGGKVTLELNGWSDHKGKSEMRTILARTRVLFERQTLIVKGFSMMAGSLTCEFEDIDREVDEDAPEKSLYRGMQRWAAVIDEAA